MSPPSRATRRSARCSAASRQSLECVQSQWRAIDSVGLDWPSLAWAGLGAFVLAFACGDDGGGNDGQDGNAGSTSFGGSPWGEGGSGNDPDEPYEPTYGRYGTPETTFTLPPNAGGGSIVYVDVQDSFPDVDFSTLDRLYLPAGEYERIQLGNLPERSAERPLVITNTGGQVRAGGRAGSHPMILGGGKNWVLTGRHDPVSKTGDASFVGHATGRFADSRDTYGIVLDDAFSKEGNSGLVVGGFASDFEIEMIEIARAEFAGLVVKTDDQGGALMRRVRLHDLYVHDTGSEGLYLGSTQDQPQHAFEELEIYDNRFIRTGTEALQVGQLGSDCEIHHNVLGPGAIRWRSAFQAYQDGNVQYGQRYGSSSFHHNVVVGTGDLFVEFFPQHVDGDSHGAADEVSFHDNYFADSSSAGVYTHADENSVTVRFEDNAFRGFRFDYDEVVPNATEPGALFGVGSNTPNPHFLQNNDFEAPFPFIQWVFDSVTESGNTATTVTPVTFRRFLGEDIDANFRSVEWWTDVVTRHPDRPVMQYETGDSVMHGGVLYRARRSNAERAPDENPDDWQEIGLPPDDARLTSDSAHAGVGLRWPPQ